MPDLPRLSNDLIQQLRGIFFAKDRSPILSQSNWLGLPLLESTPSVLPSVSNYYFYFKTNGGLYRLDWNGNEIQVNGLDSLPVHTHANNNQGGVIPLDNTTVSKLRESDDGADALTADSNGYLASVSQPLFSAYNSVSDLNVTGNGTNYTIINDTEIFDVNGNYNNATGIFTAPVTGKYLLVASVLAQGITNVNTGGQAFINTSNRVYSSSVKHPFNCAFGGTDLSFFDVVIADMDASDTAFSSIQIIGGAQIVDVFGGAAPRTFFQGYLLI